MTQDPDDPLKPTRLSGITIPASVLQPLSPNAQRVGDWTFSGGLMGVENNVQVEAQGFHVHANAGVETVRRRPVLCAAGSVPSVDGTCIYGPQAGPITPPALHQNFFYSGHAMVSGIAKGEDHGVGLRPYLTAERRIPGVPGLSAVGVVSVNPRSMISAPLENYRPQDVPQGNVLITDSQYAPETQTYRDTFYRDRSVYGDAQQGIPGYYTNHPAGNVQPPGASLGVLAKYTQPLVEDRLTLTGTGGVQADYFSPDRTSGAKASVTLHPLAGVAASLHTGRLTTTLSSQWTGNVGPSAYTQEQVADWATTHIPPAMEQTTRDMEYHFQQINNQPPAGFLGSGEQRRVWHKENRGAEAVEQIAREAKRNGIHLHGQASVTGQYDLSRTLALHAGISLPINASHQSQMTHNHPSTADSPAYVEQTVHADFLNTSLKEAQAQIGLTYTPPIKNPARCPKKSR